ncbi:MAG: carboxypeptidase-like regulatory domain-containing protein, partial [Bryobacteraceae bacterium]
MESRYGAVSPIQLPVILNVRAEETIEIVLRLVPQGVIAGRIMDEDGEPVSTGYIHLIATARAKEKLYNTVVNSVPVNDLGEYRLAGLGPGEYYLRFQPRESAVALGDQRRSGERIDTLVPTYCPRAATLREARPIRVGFGEMISGVDIVVRRSLTSLLSGYKSHRFNWLENELDFSWDSS